jgi:hypothetical protein
MLSQHGMENLKRTVGQNYFNWLVLHPRNAQLRNVFRDWRAHPTLAPFLNSMEPLGFLHSAVGLEMGLTRIGWREEFLYKLFVGMLLELARREDRSGLSPHLEEPLIGNPIRIRRKGKLISQDLANSIREYGTLLQAQPDLRSVPKKVAELGAGYGRLAYVMLQDPGTQYLVFDIPPALAVSQWYRRSSGASRSSTSAHRSFASIGRVVRPVFHPESTRAVSQRVLRRLCLDQHVA